MNPERLGGGDGRNWRKKLARYPVNGRKRSLREVAAELEAQGHLNAKGRPYAAAAVARMLAS
jgi:hypothetical protein